MSNNISIINPNNLGEVTKCIEWASPTELAALICKEHWAPALFKGASRKNSEFLSTGLLVLDIDGGHELREAFVTFKGYKHIIATTRSHGLPKQGVTHDRYRVVLFLSEEVVKEGDFRATWAAAADLWPFVDKQCGDPARLFYPCREVVSVNENGALFSVRQGGITNLPQTRLLEAGIGPKGRLSHATKDFLLEGAEVGTWNGRLFKAAVDMNEQGMSLDEALEKFRSMTNQYFSGELDASDIKTIESAFKHEPRYEPREALVENVEINWPVLVMAKDGREFPHPKHPDNFKALMTSFGVIPRFNELKNEIYAGDRPFNDYNLAALGNRCREYHLSDSKEFRLDCIEEVARQNRYHPFKEAVEVEPWDGADHISQLFGTLSIAEEYGAQAPFYQLALRRWLIGVIAKVYRPGSQNLTLVLRGKQGVGKSRWFEKFGIAPGVFSEGQLDPRNKDHVLKHLNTVIWHLSELDGITSKRESSDLKDFLTRSEISERGAYARFNTVGRSILSFVGSVNESIFLKDSTGNRRFLIIEIEGLDASHAVNMQQVFAQAKAAFDSGERWWFDTTEIPQIEELNESYTTEDFISEIADQIEPTYKEAEGDWMSLVEIFVKHEYTRPSQGEVTRLGSLLRKRKFVGRQIGASRRRMWLIKKPNKINLPRIG